MSKIAVVLPCLFTNDWQMRLADFAIHTISDNTDLTPDIIVVETGSKITRDHRYVTKWIKGKGPYSHDFNLGVIAASEADYVIHIGIDILVQEGWLEGLLEVFHTRKDAGVATLAIAEAGAYVGPRKPTPGLIEAMYGPLMMYKRKIDDQVMLLDEERFPQHASDSDLVMQFYDKGFRSYRNNRVQCHHLNGITWNTQSDQDIARKTNAAHQAFHEKWGNSPLWMAKMIMKGGVIYGREHE